MYVCTHLVDDVGAAADVAEVVLDAAPEVHAAVESGLHEQHLPVGAARLERLPLTVLPGSCRDSQGVTDYGTFRDGETPRDAETPLMALFSPSGKLVSH